jgi:energy-coupling factor transport system ATP-binding protein
MRTTAMVDAIRIERLRYAWDSRGNALEDVTLTVADNEFTAIIGQNGAGKTTLLKNITGLLRPAGGEIVIRGRNSRDMSVSAIAAEIGFVTQNPDRQLFTSTVYDEAAFALKTAGLSGAEIRRRVEDALAAVGLSEERETFPPALGRGDRAKVVIASVLAMGSKTLILDEPAAGQDYRGSRRIMDIAAELRGRGYTVLFVTHNMALAAEYAQRIVVMKDGRVYMDGSPREVFGRVEELEQAGILPPPINRLSRELRPDIPLPRDALSAAELADMLNSVV